MLAVGLAGMVLALGTSAGGGLDGPCLGPMFAPFAPEGSAASGEPSWWPPGVRCVSVAPDRSKEQRTYPGRVTWAVALLVGVAPFALRRRPRLRST
jgi:hypothetical protein